MPTQWTTFPVEFKGGLISNQSPLQQGINSIGSTTILQNMEPDRQGGYTKIKGYQKFSATEIPGTGNVQGLKVVSSGRTVVARKIDSSAVAAYQATAEINNTATASVNGATSSTTAVVVDGNSGTIVVGMTVASDSMVGTITVATVTDQNNIVLSAAQSLPDNEVLTFGPPDAVTTTHILDSISGTIAAGMDVTGTGVPSGVTVASFSGSTVTLSQAVTLSDNVALTFQKVGLQTADINKTGYYFGTGTAWTHMATSPLTGGGKIRKATFNFDGDDKTIFVDGTNYPAVYNSSGNTMSFMSSSTPNISTDLEGAELITVFDNSVVYSKNNNIYVSGQFTEANITGGGAVNIVANVGNTVTGLAVFREKLIIFTEDKIQSLVRTDASPFFKIEPVTDKIGCISSDSIQEFGGDVMYLAPDGLRLLSATDRIGDFALDVTSDRIFKDADDFLRSTPNYCSIIIREKAQYRIFAYVGSQSTDTSEGLIATKFIPQGGSGVEWSTTKGIKAFVADSIYSGTSEAVMFANEDGFLYEMEQTNGFDGSNIETIMETPYMPITDPEVRKTAYKLTLYTDPTGQMDLKFRLLFDFDSGGDTSIIQPEEIDIGSTTGGSGVFIFGQPNAVYGGTGVIYGSKLKRVYNENLIGSFHTVAMRITSNSTNPPFTLDSAILQYRQNDRQ